MYRFSFVLLCILGQFSKYKPPGGGGFYLEGRFNEGFFALPLTSLGGLSMEGPLFSEFYDNFAQISDLN